MPAMGVYDQVKKAIQDVVAPELHAIRGDIRVLDHKLDELDARLTIKIDSLRAEMVSEFRRVDARIDSVERRIDSVDGQLRFAMDVRERLAALEARVNER